MNKTIKESIDNQSIVFTDKSTSYVDISDIVELHITQKSDKEATNETQKWVHITISNTKEIYWGIITKSKESIFNCISMNLSTN